MNQRAKKAQDRKVVSSQSSIQAAQVRFSGDKNANTQLTQAQAQKIAKKLWEEDQDIFKDKKGVLTESLASLTQKIQDGGKHTFQDNYYYGVIQEDSHGKLIATGMAEQLQPMADYLTKKLDQLTPALRNKLKNGITVVVPVNPGDSWVKKKVNLFSADIETAKAAEKQANTMPVTAPMKGDDKEEKSDDPYEDFKNYVFQERFKQQATLESGLGGKKKEFTQFVAWPILQQIMTGSMAQELSDAPDNIPRFANDILKLGLYQFQSPDLDTTETTSLNKAFESMAKRLSAFKLAEKHYVEALDLKEVVGPLLGGVAIGGGGETALELAHLDNSPSAGWIRSGLLVGVDVFDNLLAQIPNVKQKMANNGWEFNTQGVTGDKSFSDYLKRAFKDKDSEFKGPAGGTVKDAISSALMGAVSGSIFAIPAGRTLSGENESAWTRAAMGGFGALGTSLSLPLKLQKDKAKSEAIIRKMMKHGLIEEPKNEKEKEKLIKQLAIQDAMAGTGNAASLKAFSLVPLLSGSVLALEKVGVPRKWTQKLYMSISPGAENLLSLALMADRQYRTSKGDMKAVEQQILKSGTASFGKNDADQQEKDAKFIAGKFNNGWGDTIGHFVTNPKMFFSFLGAVLTPMYLYSFAGKMLGKTDHKPAHAPEPKPQAAQSQSFTQPAQSTTMPATFPPVQPQPVGVPQAGYPASPRNDQMPAARTFPLANPSLSASNQLTGFQPLPVITSTPQWPSSTVQSSFTPISPNTFQQPLLIQNTVRP